MPCNVNCTQASSGKCLHPSAPRSWFGSPYCLLAHPHSDPRLRNICNLQTAHKRPDLTLKGKP